MISRFNNTENDWNCVRPISLMSVLAVNTFVWIYSLKVHLKTDLWTFTYDYSGINSNNRLEIAAAYLKKKEENIRFR